MHDISVFDNMCRGGTGLWLLGPHLNSVIHQNKVSEFCTQVGSSCVIKKFTFDRVSVCNPALPYIYIPSTPLCKKAVVFRQTSCVIGVMREQLTTTFDSLQWSTNLMCRCNPPISSFLPYVRVKNQTLAKPRI
uniref:Uncharacterized protein n=1 Tax=Sphaerodactylus townsendi TaxID=933632 RepID=A0ACB8GAU9_9SAUR